MVCFRFDEDTLKIHYQPESRNKNKSAYFDNLLILGNYVKRCLLKFTKKFLSTLIISRKCSCNQYRSHMCLSFVRNEKEYFVMNKT